MSNFKNKRPVIVTVSLWLFVVITVIISGYLIYLVQDAYSYEFPKINGVKAFLGGVISCTIPALITVLSAFSLIRSKKRMALICLIAYIPVSLIVFGSFTSHALYDPAISSYTSDPDDFSVYDTGPAEYLRLNPPKFYPDSIPEDAENVQYYYYYQNASAEVLYCAVSWQTDEEELRQVTEQMEQEEMVWQGEDQCSIYFTDRAPINAVYIDYETGKICYVVANREVLLPATMEAAFDLLLPEGFN